MKLDTQNHPTLSGRHGTNKCLPAEKGAKKQTNEMHVKKQTNVVLGRSGFMQVEGERIRLKLRRRSAELSKKFKTYNKNVCI